MYAIIREDGRQYKVTPGQELSIDLRDNLSAGATLTFGEVLAVSDGAAVRLGKPTLAGASVTAEVVGEDKGEKLVIQKFRRRKNYRRKTGHRQKYTRVKVTAIDAP